MTSLTIIFVWASTIILLSPRIRLFIQKMAGILKTAVHTANTSYQIRRLCFLCSMELYRVMVRFSRYNWSVSSPPLSLKLVTNIVKMLNQTSLNCSFSASRVSSMKTLSATLEIMRPRLRSIYLEHSLNAGRILLCRINALLNSSTSRGICRAILYLYRSSSKVVR